jgi:hypothetical protein
MRGMSECSVRTLGLSESERTGGVIEAVIVE